MSRPQRIWVIDKAPIARVLHCSLAASGYEAPVAGECEEELEIINSWATDLVITEVSTPKMGRVGVMSLMASSLLSPYSLARE